MKIENEFSELSNDDTIQEFGFKKGNNYTSVKRKLKKSLIFWQEHSQLIPQSSRLLIMVKRFSSLKPLNVLHFAISVSLEK